MEGKNIPKQGLERCQSLPGQFSPHNGSGGLVEALFLLLAVQQGAFGVAGPPVIPAFSQDHFRPYRGMMAQEDPFTGHGHAGKMPSLISQPFCNEQEPGFLPELEIPAEIGRTDHRCLGSDITGGIIFPPGIETAVPMELLQCL